MLGLPGLSGLAPDNPVSPSLMSRRQVPQVHELTRRTAAQGRGPAKTHLDRLRRAVFAFA